MPKLQPIQAAILEWIHTLTPPEETDIPTWQQDLLDHAPKRFTIYGPMALLPAGSFTSSQWTSELGRHDPTSLTTLWQSLLRHLSQSRNTLITHLAVNEGIPAHNDDETENVLRRPSGLRVLHGDFGPSRCGAGAEDFEGAFWVATKQNGIWQTWAPRWTMFSRGNVKEKARLLGFPSVRGEGAWAVDFYAGIGYFAFCYVVLGMRVLCWEMNPWSVEAMRRGARLNGWTVDVVCDGREVEATTAEIVVFCEDNGRAGLRLEEARRSGWLRDVRHVNCGLLPTSRLVWECALGLSLMGDRTWLHLHENVGEGDMETRRGEIKERLLQLLRTKRAAAAAERHVCMEHVEKVKTFAPSVWHCVFDVLVTTDGLASS